MSSYVIASLLDKMTKIDSDIRFMAIQDLYSLLESDSFSLDSPTEQKALEDSNSEVQNIAQKCLLPLSKKIHKVEYTLGLLMDFLLKSKDHTDIAPIALRSFLLELPLDQSTSLWKLLFESLLKLLKQRQDMDSIDSLTTSLDRFGMEFALLKMTALQQDFMQFLFGILDSNQRVIRKRSIQALGSLVLVLDDNLFNDLCNQTLSQLDACASSSSFEKLQSLLLLVSTLCKARSAGFRNNINGLLIKILEYTTFEDDDLTDQALLTIQVFVECGLIEYQSLHSTLERSIELLAYDPNYNDDDEMEFSDEEDEEDYSDEDDQSWKVRRASAKLIGTIASHYPTRSDVLYSRVGTVLIKRFSERVEVVRLEIFGTFQLLIQGLRFDESTKVQTRKKQKIEQGSVDVYFHAKLREDMPTIVQAVATQFQTNSTDTIQAGYTLLSQIIETSQDFSGVLDKLKGSISQHASLNNTNLKIQILDFVNSLLKLEDVMLHRELISTVVGLSRDRFYKVRSKSVVVLESIVENIFQEERMGDPTVESTVTMIMDPVLELLDTDEETDVIVCCIATLSRLVSRASSVLDLNNVEQKLVPLLKTYLEQESTILASLDGIRELSSTVNFQPSVWIEFIKSIKPLLSKSNRNILMSAIPTLSSILPKVELEPSLVQEIINDLEIVFAHQPDSQILRLSFDLLTLLVDKAELGESTIVLLTDLIKKDLVSTGHTCDSFLQLWERLLVVSSGPMFEIGVSRLVAIDTILNVSKESFMMIAKCIGKCAQTPNCKQLVDVLVQYLDSDNEKQVSFALLCLGELGSLSDLQTIAPELHLRVATYIKSTNAEIQNSAAQSLGRMGHSPNKFYLDFIFQKIHDSGYDYYFILAFHESILLFDSTIDEQTIQKCWSLLFEPAVVQTQGTRNIASDSIGALALVQPRLLTALVANLGNIDADARHVSLSGLRYFVLRASKEVDGFLSPLIPTALKTLEDSDIGVCKASLDLFQSLMTTKLRLIKNLLPDLLGVIYNHLVFKKEYTTIVQMGPFQHKVDNSLETRKAAFDAIGLYLDNTKDLETAKSIIEHLMIGLTDPSNIIIIKTHSILNSCLQTQKQLMYHHLPPILESLSKTIFIQPKDTIVKQDLENHRLLIKSSLQCLYKYDQVFAKGNLDIRLLVKKVLDNVELAAIYNQL